MGVLHVKPGVDFGTEFAPAGARILEVLKGLVRSYSFDVTITSARDGRHSGPTDPHHTGEAFDIRTHDLSEPARTLLLADLKAGLGGRFYAFLEAPGTPNEHIHCQRRQRTVYTVLDYLASA